MTDGPQTAVEVAEVLVFQRAAHESAHDGEAIS